MEVKIEHLLPIGSIVKLNGSDKKIMVIGFCVAPKQNPNNEVFDYMGCLWPQGVVDSEMNIVFNEENITKVLSKGEYNEEEADFKKKLAEAIKKATSDENNTNNPEE